MPAARRRELAVVLLFSALSCAVFLNKAWHVDEPCFLAMARHVLADPLHPMEFSYNWHGAAEPMSRINPNPPLVPFLIAPALWASGGREWPTRLLLLPFDLLAAAALYFLAARFLKKPLLPTLIVLAGPAWVIDMPMLAAEKWVAAFGLTGIVLLVSATDEDDARRFWLSAAFLALALLSKLSAVFFLAPAFAWAARRGVKPRRLIGYLAVAVLPAAAAVLASGPGRLVGLWRHTAGSPYASGGAIHTLRAFLAFTGGCLLPAAVWPLLGSRPKAAGLRAFVLVAAAAAALLFLPALDAEPALAWDRALGVLFSLGALLAVWEALRPNGAAYEARLLWAPWIAAAALLQLLVYWSVVSRFVLFLVPPLTFAAAAALEGRLTPARLRRVHLVGLAAAAAVSLALGAVDRSYAAASKEAAALAARLDHGGGRLWFTGHWGLQEYMEKAGASALDRGRGGWDEVSAGDLVVVPTVNALVLHPEHAMSVRSEQITVRYWLPLRLISGWTGQAGFYSSASGFLPYAFSLEPLDRFLFARKL